MDNYILKEMMEYYGVNSSASLFNQMKEKGDSKPKNISGWYILLVNIKKSER